MIGLSEKSNSFFAVTEFVIVDNVGSIGEFVILTKRCDSGPPFLGVMELELVVLTARPIPECVIRREEPSMLFIGTPVLILPASGCGD